MRLSVGGKETRAMRFNVCLHPHVMKNLNEIGGNSEAQNLQNLDLNHLVACCDELIHVKLGKTRILPCTKLHPFTWKRMASECNQHLHWTQSMETRLEPGDLIPCLHHLKYLVGTSRACHCGMGHISLESFLAEITRQYEMDHKRDIIKKWVRMTGTNIQLQCQVDLEEVKSQTCLQVNGIDEENKIEAVNKSDEVLEEKLGACCLFASRIPPFISAADVRVMKNA